MSFLIPIHTSQVRPFRELQNLKSHKQVLLVEYHKRENNERDWTRIKSADYYPVFEFKSKQYHKVLIPSDKLITDDTLTGEYALDVWIKKRKEKSWDCRAIGFINPWDFEYVGIY